MKEEPILTTINTYNKIAQKYTEEFFDDWSEKECLDQFLSTVKKGGKILDAGCGPGNFAKYFFNHGFEVQGIDLSEEMIKIARSKVPEVQFDLMDMRELNYNEESFNGVCAAYSLIHIPQKDIANTLMGFNRILENDGILFLALQEGQGERLVDEPFNPAERGLIKFFSIDEIIEELNKCNFRVIYTEIREPNSEKEFNNRKLFVVSRKISDCNNNL